MKKHLIIIATVLLFAACGDDEYETGKFTGSYTYTETSNIKLIQKGDIIDQIDQTVKGKLRIFGSYGKLTATFTPEMREIEIHEYIISGDEIRSNSSGEIVINNLAYPVNILELGILEDNVLTISILLDGTYEFGLNRGFIEGTRQIVARKNN